MTENQRTILIIDDCPEDRNYRRYLQQDSKYTYTILEEEYKMGWMCRLVNQMPFCWTSCCQILMGWSFWKS